jgi:hypothetical protein
MNSTLSWLRPAGLLLAGLCVFGLGNARPARAQDPDALAKVKDLNKKAVDAYENLDLDEARKALMTALEICATEGLNRHALKATTHLNLGVVLVGGLKQREAGVKQFRRALEIDSNAKVPKRLTNPEIQSAFEAATKEMAGSPPLATEPGPATPPPPAAGEGPKPPPAATGARPIGHSPVTEAKPDEDVPITAVVDEGLKFERLVLAYRPEGASDFLARDMEAETGGEYVARIPEPATRGGSVAYYIEARGRGGQALARNGSPDEPHIITLGAAGADAVAQASSDDEPDDEPRGVALGKGKLWLSLGLGGGGGYASGSPEVNPNYLDPMTGKQSIKVSSMAAAKLMHFVPEVGYFVNPRFLLSVQGRLQYTTGATEVHHASCGTSQTCKPATGAIAVLGRATWLVGGKDKFQPFVSVLAGGGYIRYLFDLGDFEGLRTCGPSQNQRCLDTVAGGGLLVGPSAGMLYALTPQLYLTGTAAALLGVPKTAFNVDLNLGIGYKL